MGKRGHPRRCPTDEYIALRIFGGMKDHLGHELRSVLPLGKLGFEVEVIASVLDKLRVKAGRLDQREGNGGSRVVSRA